MKNFIDTIITIIKKYYHIFFNIFFIIYNFFKYINIEKFFIISFMIQYLFQLLLIVYLRFFFFHNETPLNSSATTTSPLLFIKFILLPHIYENNHD